MARHPAGSARTTACRICNCTTPDARPDCPMNSCGCHVTATLADVATVTVKKAVDGTRKRKARGKNRPKLGGKVDQIKVDPRIMRAAKEAMRPGQRLVIVDAECVRLVNR